MQPLITALGTEFQLDFVPMIIILLSLAGLVHLTVTLPSPYFIKPVNKAVTSKTALKVLVRLK